MANREYTGVGYGENKDDAFVDFYIRASEARDVAVAKISVLRESYKKKNDMIECHATYFVQGEKFSTREKTTKPSNNHRNKTKDNITLTARVRPEENESILAGDLTSQLDKLVREWDVEEKGQ